MKIALLSDIHANRQALDACLTHARAHGAEQFALLGDLVGYGGEPVAVVEQVRDLAQQGALCVLGNHDAMALAPPANPRNRSELGAQWTHDQLGNSQRQATSFELAQGLVCAGFEQRRQRKQRSHGKNL